MSTIKDKAAELGHDVADAAKNVGHKIADGAAKAGHAVADGAAKAADFVKEKTGLGPGNDMGIKEKMDVIASCGTKVGVVDHVGDGAIKLTRNDSPDNQHHFIPTSWVKTVDTHVHLSKNSMETRQGWKADAAAAASA